MNKYDNCGPKACKLYFFTLHFYLFLTLPVAVGGVFVPGEGLHALGGGEGDGSIGIQRQVIPAVLIGLGAHDEIVSAVLPVEDAVISREKHFAAFPACKLT